jgi:hypothetical protein
MLFDSEKLTSKIVKAGFILIFVVLVASAFLSPVHRCGDTSTYYMQIDSITHDFDIEYEKIDIDRIFLDPFDDLPAGLFLIKDPEGNLFYGKEFTYALFASPFYWLMGKSGILVFNSVMFFLMICMSYVYIRFKNSEKISFLVSNLFFFLSTAYVYIYWVHAEIYNMFLIMLGFYVVYVS